MMNDDHPLSTLNTSNIEPMSANAGVNLAVIEAEDMAAVGAEQLLDCSECAQLLTHTTTVGKMHRAPSRYRIC